MSTEAEKRSLYVGSPRKIGLLILAAWVLCAAGCGPTIETRTAAWPNGQLRAKETYYLNSSGARVMHGVSTYWDERGSVVAEGTWQDGKPMEGVCWIPAAGDAGSWGGLGHFEKFKGGKSLGKVPGSP
jgi:hypothetical protein